MAGGAKVEAQRHKKQKSSRKDSSRKNTSRKDTSRKATAQSQMKSGVAALRELVAPHVSSFNFFLDQGLALAVESLAPMSLDADLEKGLPAVKFWIEDVQVTTPVKPEQDAVDTRLWPNEARERLLTYAAMMTATICYTVGDSGKVVSVQKSLGQLPIMVKSNACHLRHLTPSQLVARKEEATEFGGCFIVNGIERIIRMILLPKRNTVSTLVRASLVNRGSLYTTFATVIRCVTPDETSRTISVHYLTTGACNVRVSFRKQEFFLPASLLLKAFMPTTDRHVFECLLQGELSNHFLADRAEVIVREAQKSGLKTRKQILRYMGNMFRVVLRQEQSVTDEELGQYILDELLFIHCTTGQQKFHLLIHMIRKLYALVQGDVKPDNPDALNNHEVLTAGHMCLRLVKENLAEWLLTVKSVIRRDARLNTAIVQLDSEAYWKKLLENGSAIGKALHYFLVTGNLRSTTGLDLMQKSGFTIVADKLNALRYMSHFRSIHRGQFFTEMKTTTVRKLLPESWGFMCPVHTPDGTPCGLLNHMAAPAKVQCVLSPVSDDRIVNAMCLLGLHDNVQLPIGGIPVILNGIVVGSVATAHADRFCKQLRLMKVNHHKDVPSILEITPIFNTQNMLFPCIDLSTGPARLSRPVKFLRTEHAPDVIELISPSEQVFMEIACVPEDFRSGETTHMELAPTQMLSIISSFTPFSDFNQSPRNMYQCQMGKQTMGTPFHSIPHRTDNKVYRIQSPQRPVVRNDTHEKYMLDEYPLATNAIVAVISYTGYDMEDAMIINKSAHNRGFGHGSVYKYKKIDLADYRQRGEPIHHRFGNLIPAKDAKMIKGRRRPQNVDGYVRCSEALDDNGLPMIGTRLTPGDPLYCVINDVTGKAKVTAFKDTEDAIIEEVRLLGSPTKGELQQLGIKLRYNRNPVIGDKFAARHGQKGVMSVLWPQEDMPFTESGMTPDIIINPHAFPSRMTIGMLVESMAGKAGCVHGKTQDSTPFQYSEKNTAVEHFGKELVQAGYNYYGTEVMYSGVTGVEMKAEIFFGVVYYQRLRHMVSDKSQVRSTGPVNEITRQPVKGRKIGGGVRFGEMERDSLLAHGTSFLLNDRLMQCSDYHTTPVCTLCGSLLAPSTSVSLDNGQIGPVQCRWCKTDKGCSTLAVPYVFVYLANELAAMNIKVTLDVK